MKKSKLILIGILVGIITLFVTLDLGQYLTLEFLKSQQGKLTEIYQENTLLTCLVFFLIYVITTALSLPGATILTLAGGVIFGFWLGLFIVSFASTFGATLAFLIARFFFQDYIQKKFPDKTKLINQGMKKEGDFYLFTLRLVPIVPFFVINLAMGLTQIKAWRFFIISQIGMLAGTAVYVNAGTQIAKIAHLKDIMSPGLLISFVLLGLFPITAKKVLDILKSRKALRRFPKPETFDYNLVVIGAGAGGLVSSYIAAAVKAKVALIEKHKMGGDCLNTGCVPSKAILKSAKVVEQIKKAESFGIEATVANVDFARVMQRVKNVIKKIEPHDSIERYKGLGVDCIEGHANIKSPYCVTVNGRNITTKNIIIATGARPFIPPIEGLDQINFRTSDTIWEIDELPKRLLILGGGAIGCELSQAFQNIGSKVTLVEMAPRLIPREDPEASSAMEKSLKKTGITLLYSHKAIKFTSAKKGESGGELELLHSDKKVNISFDMVLLALGRTANVEGFGAEELGLDLDEKGRFVTDPYLRTNIPNIFVCGDATGDLQFTHVAAHEAWYAAVNALFRPFKSFRADYRVIPMITYTNPEIARVGINEIEAKEKNIPYEVTTYGIDDLDRAIADSNDHGLVKVLTVPGKDKILGVTIVGSHAGEMLAEFVLAMKYNLGLNKILGTIHAYPTYMEANKYAAGEWKRAHAPQRVLKIVEKFHSWRRE